MLGSASLNDRVAVEDALEGRAEENGAPIPFAHLFGLVLAGVVACAVYIAITRDGRAARPIRAPGSPARAAAEAPPSGSSSLLTPRPTPPRTPLGERLAGLPGARERFSFTIRHPAYLPADIAPFEVDWQPDPSDARRARGLGELQTWFYSEEHGGILVLAQGPGVGVETRGLRPDQWGMVWLADGTAAVWTVGHPVWDEPLGRAGPDWIGTELTLGVPRSDGEGWYLRSPIVRLEELVRIANSLR
jgi:hypothetical protein